MIAATVANAFRGKGRAAQVEDFMPRFGPAQPRKSAREIQMIAQQWAMQHNARVRKEKQQRKEGVSWQS